MYCSSCGNKLNDDHIFCGACGKKVAYNNNIVEGTIKRTTIKCECCGGSIKQLSKNSYICEYCGSEHFASDDGIVTENKLSEKELVEILFRAANYELKNDFYNELQCLLSISDKASDNVIVLVKIGRAYSRNYMYEKAVEYYEKALAVNPNYATAYTNLGAIYIYKNLYEKAEKYTKHAIALMNDNRMGYSDNDYATAYANYSVAVGKLGRIDEAERLLESAEALGYTNGKNIRKMIGLKQKPWYEF